MRKPLALVFGAGLALSGIAMSAQAMPMAPAPGAQSPVVKVGFLCGPGYHLGPHGRYCWPNGVTNVPPHWTKVCPPGYHLGPKGRQCWHN
jgi:hypothetical protein